MGFTATKATEILQSAITKNVYVGLSTSTPTAAGGNFTEPVPASGYARSLFGEVNTSIAAQVANNAIIFFNETLGEGYGTVTHFGLFSAPSGGTPFFTGELTSALTIGAGYVPIFRAKQLVIGLDKEVLSTYG